MSSSTSLPADLMVLIMQRVGWHDVLTNVKLVCKYWYVLSKDPSIWRVIEFRKYILSKKLIKKMLIPNYPGYYRKNILSKKSEKAVLCNKDYEKEVDKIMEKALHKMFMHVIDLSSGQLQDLCLQDFGSDNLFKYIYQRSSQLRSLRLEYCYVDDLVQHDRFISHEGLIEMLRNLPLLEELQLPYTRILEKGIEIAGQCCPRLKTFILKERISYSVTHNLDCDKQALAIAKSMPGLRHLQLFGNRMTITGLMAILNNCHHLEYLDLRQCYNLCKVLEEPELVTKLRQQIKHVRFPNDSTEDYEFSDKV